MLSIRPLSNELQKIAINELHENQDTIYDNVQHIREWALTQEHLKLKTDDQSLVNQLRFCKYDLELSKQKLETMCTMRTNLPGIFSNRDPFLPEIQELLNKGLFLPFLKTENPGSPLVALIQASALDPSTVKPEDAVKCALMIGDILCNEYDNLIVTGAQCVADWKDVSVRYTKLFEIGLISSVYKLYNRAYAVTPVGAFSINTPKFMEVGYHTFKYILSSEHRKLIHIYSGGHGEELHKDISPSILPKELGGTESTIAELTGNPNGILNGEIINFTILAYWKEKMESYRDWFLEEEQYRLQKTKLPKKTGWF